MIPIPAATSPQHDYDLRHEDNEYFFDYTAVDDIDEGELGIED